MQCLPASLVHCLLALCLALNGLAWAGHVDMPAPAADTAVEAPHAHVDGGELVAGCDHCCHAGAHLLALHLQAGATVPLRAARVMETDVPDRADPVADPPFIPPIS